jgi:hypothetical protein
MNTMLAMNAMKRIDKNLKRCRSWQLAVRGC